MALFTALCGWGAAFLLFPVLDERWTAAVMADVVSAYGPQNLQLVRLFWQGLLVLLIFAAVRTALNLALAAFSLALAALLFLRRRRDRHERK
ncbi:MAG: hypothetical protein AAGG47_17880 [Pseudomonadota bacterium]